jgi:hypothetical protein
MNISSIGSSAIHLNVGTQPAVVKPTTEDQKTLIQAVKTVNSSVRKTKSLSSSIAPRESLLSGS